MQNKRQTLKENWTLISQEEQSNIYVNKCSTAFFPIEFLNDFPPVHWPQRTYQPLHSNLVKKTRTEFALGSSAVSAKNAEPEAPLHNREELREVSSSACNVEPLVGIGPRVRQDRNFSRPFFEAKKCHLRGNKWSCEFIKSVGKSCHHLWPAGRIRPRRPRENSLRTNLRGLIVQCLKYKVNIPLMYRGWICKKEIQQLRWR